MPESTPFLDLIRRVRAGDQDAAAELVSLYEPAIRRAARVRAVDPRLRCLLDSMDISQSVFGSFFLRLAQGQFELQKPEQLLRLLVSMSQRKLVNFARRQGAARRNYRRLAALPESNQLVCDGYNPSREAAGKELQQEFRKRLNSEERELAELRAAGREWEHISAACGDSAEALRKKLARAVKRVAQELELDEVHCQ